MIERCTNQKSKAYKNYGGKGISVCNEWKNFVFFYDWAKKALCDNYYKGKDRANSQLYKQAGNSICVNVLMEIFKKIFLD